MKDLFVELARLQSCHGQLTEIALDLRDHMLARSTREADLERLFAETLDHLATLAQQLSADLEACTVGINFTSEEFPEPYRRRPKAENEKASAKC